MTRLALIQGVVAGHPIWHFAVVAGAGVLTLVIVKAVEWWKGHGYRLSRPSPTLWALSILGGGSALIHGLVCRQHFSEWVWYGIFFLCASTVQTIWSILILLRPSRRLLLLGALGNTMVIVTYLVSRTSGMPFGPEAFQPETFDTLSLIATTCEIGLVLLATRVLLAGRHHPEMPSVLIGSLDSRS
jgi:hypothetical protein